MYTCGLLGCTPTNRLGVHLRTAWVYTYEPIRCTPESRLGVHVGSALVYTCGRETSAQRHSDIFHNCTKSISRQNPFRAVMTRRRVYHLIFRRICKGGESANPLTATPIRIELNHHASLTRGGRICYTFTRLSWGRMWKVES